MAAACKSMGINVPRLMEVEELTAEVNPRGQNSHIHMEKASDLSPLCIPVSSRSASVETVKSEHGTATWRQ